MTSRFTKFNQKGFTLLEVLVALAILGIAVTYVLQLFSTNMRTISLSRDYGLAAMQAEARMRQVLDDDQLNEQSWSEVTSEGYRLDLKVSNVLVDRTDNLAVKLLAIDLTIRWQKGVKERSLTLRTVKLTNKTGFKL
ncbi:MAG: type II secretion system minor pseudopilin GspI [Proteobacteria bacterium]|nr:type II secretion system minor pseudopilin GspI [Pseudomonadota bacterium]